MLEVFTLFHDEGGPCERILRGSTVCRHGSAWRRWVLVRMSETGEHLETVRIVNARDVLADVMSLAGESPEVVLEATYG